MKRNKIILFAFAIGLLFLGALLLNPKEDYPVTYGEAYTSKEDVAAYLHYFEELPPNYVTKKEASLLGWTAKEGNLWEVCENCSIGGDVFKNREKLLPELEGRHYYECDINYKGGYRNSERIVYSDDGLIYYTEDHYASFERLYGGDDE